MNRRNWQMPSMLWLLLALLVLLPLLAYWQYRWLGEVSDAERERMQRNLQAAATQFGQEFDQELTFAYITLQDAPFTFESTPQGFAERYRQWAEAATHPRLINAIYQVQTAAPGEFQLWRFDPATRVFTPAEWTPDLQPIRQSLQEQRDLHEHVQQLLHNILPTSGGLPTNGVPASGGSRDSGEASSQPKSLSKGTAFIQMSSPGPLDERLPGLVLPLGQIGPLPLGYAQTDSYRIVLFDLAYIKQELLPELARKHFFNNGTRDYVYSVLQADKPDPQVIFESEAQTATRAGDAMARFFRVKLDARDRLILSKGYSVNVFANETRTAEVRTNGLSGGTNERVATTRQQETRVKGLPNPVTELSQSISTLHKRSDGSWQLVVRHRAGSLDAAVAGLRRRNLAISIGVLLLLSVSVGLIVLSSRRAQALAQKQIEFVAGVSHELRTPLSVICAAAENLADGVPGLIDNREQVKRYGTLIRDEGRRLSGMVEQVLEFAGAESGKQNYDLRPVAPKRVIEGALAALHLPLQESGFAVEMQLADALPLINADAPALSRAVQNLISNALKYGGDHRWLRVSAGVAKTLHGEELQLSITDHGLGIAAEELPHIFEPFYRGKEVSAAQIHGNGLGLSLVKHIIEAHGGRITVESQSGQGSTFTLHLPVPREAAATQLLLANEAAGE